MSEHFFDPYILLCIYCMAGVFGGSVWRECVAGVFGGSVWRECVAGVFGRVEGAMCCL